MALFTHQYLPCMLGFNLSSPVSKNTCIRKSYRWGSTYSPTNSAVNTSGGPVLAPFFLLSEEQGKKHNWIYLNASSSVFRLYLYRRSQSKRSEEHTSELQSPM